MNDVGGIGAERLRSFVERIERLEEEKAALTAAGQKAEVFFFDAAKSLDTKLVEVYKKNGVKVVSMTPEQQAKWIAIAKESSYKNFSEKVPGGKELIEKALAVE